MSLLWCWGFFLSLMENVTVFHVLLAQWPSANTLYLSGSDESISTQNENKSVQTVGGEDPDLSCLQKSPVPFSSAEERLSQRIVGSVDIFSDAATPVKTNQQDKTRLKKQTYRSTISKKYISSPVQFATSLLATINGYTHAHTHAHTHTQA